MSEVVVDSGGDGGGYGGIGCRSWWLWMTVVVDDGDVLVVEVVDSLWWK